ncbi:hypothetical protein VE01_10663 [Pseudogymnoascus verrucosus]|uniref:Uncharacterized protein n=1 Tax=Pseudogymnoascus verrucosus TaxID=342668 RepID=A0A1B8G678_9PEZI|nr:uncharacterized protein VE01_10663 [Pseudogymnoascus verrucosus]OBT91336.1 hypothetical protein VE01_10663 [Pseudogymnoascus verrucosus]
MRPALLRPLRRLSPGRPYTTTKPPSPTPAPATPPDTSTRTRLNKLLDRTPKFLHPYTNGLRNAPVSHIISFLILHELTAIIPLIGLSAAFHYSEWTPEWMRERGEEYEGRFRRYFGRKGWFGVEAVGDGGVAASGVDGVAEGEGMKAEGGGGGVRIVMEVATAYAVTKVLLPVRIVGSVWATPWFARVVVGRFKRLGGLGR